MLQDFDDQPRSQTKQSKGKANAFLMFMLEYRRKQNASGKQLDMNESQVLAGELWDKMSMSERQKYSNKTLKEKNSNEAPKKYTSFGVTIDSIVRMKKEEEARIRSYGITVEEMLETAILQKRLKTMTFYFFSASYFVQTLQNDIYPAEIAMSKFSLAEGVYDSFHTFVNPGELPLGTAADALSYSEQTHKRDLPPKIEGETDYSVILGMILKFIDVPDSSKKRLPVMFVDPGINNEHFKAAKFTLDKIFEAYSKNVEVRLFPIEYLLFKLRDKCAETPFSSVLIAKHQMNNDKFMYSDVGCDFHRSEDCNQHCCLAKVKRWGYTISMFCLNENDPKIPDRHFPKTEAIVNEDDDDFSDVSSQWDSHLTSSFSRIRINSETTISHRSYASVASSVADSRISSVSSNRSMESASVNKKSSNENASSRPDSFLSISEKIKRASNKSTRGRYRQH